VDLRLLWQRFEGKGAVGGLSPFPIADSPETTPPSRGSIGFQPVAKKGGCEMDVKKINELFSKELKVINMGLDSFADNLRKKEVAVLQMDWNPPAGGNKRLISLLERLGR
jgi:hypothetical protein